MFSTRTTSNPQTTTTGAEQTPPVVTEDSTTTIETEPEENDCIPTYIPMNLQIVPQLEVTVCKPKITIKNKAVCVPNCNCDDKETK